MADTGEDDFAHRVGAWETRIIATPIDVVWCTKGDALMIRKPIAVLGFFLLLGMTAAAQEEPKAEVFAGYSYIHAVPGGGLSHASFNGGSGSISYNPTAALGLVADFGGYHVGSIGGTTVDANLYTFLFGPKLVFRTGRVEPFGQLLFGGAHANSGLYGVSTSAFAMSVGGGVDVKATRWMSVRVIQIEYLMTRFDINAGTTSTTGGTQNNASLAAVSTPSPGTISGTQNNARISAGVVFRFGGN